MKKSIIRFKERTKSKRGYEVYYKEIPKILLRYYFHKLNKKGCWDIEVIDIVEDIAKKLDECYKISSEEIDNHIPRIDSEVVMTEAELYQKQVETCKQVQNMINELYISKDKIKDKIKVLEKELNRYYMEGKVTYNHEYATFLKGKINILYDILEE